MRPSVKYVICKIAEEKKWGKKWMEIMSIKGGRGLTLNGKFHFKFPFYLAYDPGHKRLGHTGCY